ncbi:hypothetical protein FQR65_LT20307 [Abscondita terminalis]|nr:hypothetical protein FQR65_LT20307 [Abscondita terminalis]
MAEAAMEPPRRVCSSGARAFDALYVTVIISIAPACGRLARLQCGRALTLKGPAPMPPEQPVRKILEAAIRVIDREWRHRRHLRFGGQRGGRDPCAHDVAHFKSAGGAAASRSNQHLAEQWRASLRESAGQSPSKWAPSKRYVAYVRSARNDHQKGPPVVLSGKREPPRCAQPWTPSIRTGPARARDLGTTGQSARALYPRWPPMACGA